jgi:enoyl-CoA hydratase/carnithine racemase
MTSSKSDDDDLLYEVREGVGLISLNRPEARNALTFAMYERLAGICAGVDPAGAVKALVMTGAGGRAFAAGTDISAFRGFTTPEHALTYERRMDEVLNAIETCPVPTIAALAGACTGGGAAIAASCDLRLASRDLRFGFPIARTLGNCLSSASLSRMAALIGAARTREIIFTARLIEAEEALGLGLVSELHDDHAKVLGRAFELARTLMGHAPLTLRATKIALRRMRMSTSGGSDEDLITMCYMSEDFREGLEAFLAKRPPRWKGK